MFKAEWKRIKKIHVFPFYSTTNINSFVGNYKNIINSRSIQIPAVLFQFFDRFGCINNLNKVKVMRENLTNI